MAKNIYEYIGKKELFRRAQNVSYIELPKMKELVYSKFEGCEWLENEKITIRSQVCGTWILIQNRREHEEEILCGYDGEGNFSRHYVNGKNIAVKADNKSSERLKILLELDLDNLPGLTAWSVVSFLYITVKYSSEFSHGTHLLSRLKSHLQAPDNHLLPDYFFYVLLLAYRATGHYQLLTKHLHML